MAKRIVKIGVCVLAGIGAFPLALYALSRWFPAGYETVVRWLGYAG